MTRLAIELAVNGERRRLSVPAGWRLLDALRDGLGLVGTKECCGTGDCGACTVLLDGVAVNACVFLAAAAHGRRVETIEGLRGTPETAALVEAFAAGGAIQCGFCTPGMVVAATALLRSGRPLDERAVRAALAGNLCRCTGYVDIVEAVRSAGRALAEAAAEAARR